MVLLHCSIPWSEVIDNFAPPERTSKLPVNPIGSIGSIGSTGSTGSNAAVSSLEESRRISTPKARIVNRKRLIVLREEKKVRVGSAKRNRVAEEDAYYLKINNENLQALKAHLESVKLKEKELKQKKHKKKM